jgi:surface protein
MRIKQQTIIFTLSLLLMGNLAQAQFVTVWQTNIKGAPYNDQISVYLASGRRCQGSQQEVSWQEVGNPKNRGKAMMSNHIDLTFPKPGKYRVSITGSFASVKFFREWDKLKLIKIEKWGNVRWQTLDYAFAGCVNMDCTATDAPNLSYAKSLRGMFAGCKKFNGKIGHWDVSQVTNMSCMFAGAESFNQPLNNWNVGKVISMRYMFQDAISFNQPLYKWKVSQVIYMKDMFKDATSFKQKVQHWKQLNK